MDIEQIAQAAAAEIDQARDAKVQSIRELATTAQRVAEAKEALVEAERQHARSFQAAERTGWDDRSIRKLGIEVPERRAGGRPRKTKPSENGAER